MKMIRGYEFCFFIFAFGQLTMGIDSWRPLRND